MKAPTRDTLRRSSPNTRTSIVPAIIVTEIRKVVKGLPHVKYFPKTKS